MNIIFLDFDGVLDTASYDVYLVRKGMPECDENGRPVFDPKRIENLKHIIAATGQTLSLLLIGNISTHIRIYWRCGDRGECRAL